MQHPKSKISKNLRSASTNCHKAPVISISMPLLVIPKFSANRNQPQVFTYKDESSYAINCWHPDIISYDISENSTPTKLSVAQFDIYVPPTAFQKELKWTGATTAFSSNQLFN